MRKRRWESSPPCSSAPTGSIQMCSKKPTPMPLWIVLSCHSMIALGTMFGGWRIVRTMGNKLSRLQPMGGVCAESAAAATLFFASYKGPWSHRPSFAGSAT